MATKLKLLEDRRFRWYLWIYCSSRKVNPPGFKTRMMLGWYQRCISFVVHERLVGIGIQFDNDFHFWAYMPNPYRGPRSPFSSVYYDKGQVTAGICRTACRIRDIGRDKQEHTLYKVLKVCSLLRPKKMDFAQPRNAERADVYSACVGASRIQAWEGCFWGRVINLGS